MNTVKNTLFLCACFFITLKANAQHVHDGSEISCKEAHAFQHSIDNAKNAQLASLPDDGRYDLKYYRFEWSIDPAVSAISGKATAYFVTTQAGVNNLRLHLSSSFTIDAVQYHGASTTHTTTAPYDLVVNLPTALPNGTLDSITIQYHGSPPSSGFGSFNVGTHSGAPVLWTLSEPYGAQDWWPSKNGISDKIDSIDVYITVPNGNRAASNGLLVSETTVTGNQKLFHWKHRYPIASYLIAIAVTNYTQYTDIVPLSNGTQLPMLNYVYPEDLAAAQSGTADLVDVLSFFDSLFVTYPFYTEKYGHAQFNWGGGMEHQTMSFVVGYDFGLLAHELAHQWFGDMVTCNSWEDIWLNEGFATFLEGLSRERFQPAEWTQWKATKVPYITSAPDGSVKVDDTTSVGRIFDSRLSYSKGAYLLNMLRWKLGNQVFYQGVRNYLNDRGYDFGRTSMLKTHLETVSGTNLTEFFNDWYTGEGYPSYQLTWQQVGNNFNIKLDQTTSHSSVSFFELPVPVRVSNLSGQSQMLRLEHTANGQVFTNSVPFTVTQVEIDPDLHLVSANNTVTQGIVSGTSNISGNTLTANIFPNPASDKINIDFGKPIENGKYSIFNTSGMLVLEGAINQTQIQEINLNTLPSGLYFIRVTLPTGTQLCSISKN